VTCAEAVRGLDGLEDADVVRQQRVEVAQRRDRALVGDDLSAGVDAAVRAAGDGQGDGAAQQGLQRRLQLTLDGALAGLDRPAVEARAVVLEGELRRRRQTSSR